MKSSFLKKILFFTVVSIILLISPVAGSSSGNPIEFLAPGGGEADLERDILKYYSTKKELIRMTWQDFVLNAVYLEYYRHQGLIKGKQQVKIVWQQTPVRMLTCRELIYQQVQNRLTARQNVVLKYGEELLLKGDLLKWDRRSDQVELRGSPVIAYQDWLVRGSQINGEIEAGIFEIEGPVVAERNEMKITAGRVRYHAPEKLLYCQEQPVLVKGRNQLTAVEIIYDLQQKKIITKGPTRSLIVEKE